MVFLKLDGRTHPTFRVKDDLQGITQVWQRVEDRVESGILISLAYMETRNAVSVALGKT